MRLFYISIASLLAYYFDFSTMGEFAIFIFLLSAVYDLFQNLIPNERQIVLSDGTITYNDGAQLGFLFLLKRISRSKINPLQLYNDKKYAEASEEFQKIIQKGYKRDFIYGLLLSSLLQICDYKKAKIVADEYLELKPKSANDYVNIGLVNSFLDFHDTALECYEMALKVNSENVFALNNIGFTYNNMGKYEEAIQLMDKLLVLDPNFSHAYSNRGLAKIKIGILESGLEDLNHSLKLDEKNAYAYRHLGIYHLEKTRKMKR